jgi:hypothetical protein
MNPGFAPPPVVFAVNVIGPPSQEAPEGLAVMFIVAVNEDTVKVEVPVLLHPTPPVAVAV